MIVQAMDKYDFREWFARSSERENQFSWLALGALFDYLDDLSDDTGEPMEFDPIANNEYPRSSKRRGRIRRCQ